MSLNSKIMRISSPLKVGISLPVFKNIVLSFKIGSWYELDCCPRSRVCSCLVVAGCCGCTIDILSNFLKRRTGFVKLLIKIFPRLK